MSKLFSAASLILTALISSANAQNALKFQTASFNDPAMANLTAFTALIPAGWQFEGGVRWIHTHAQIANLVLKMADPHTGAQAELLPVDRFIHIVNPPYPTPNFKVYQGKVTLTTITNPAEFVSAVYAPLVLKHLQGVSPIAGEEMPAFEQIGAANEPQGTQVKSYRVRYAFQNNGQPWEEDVYMTFTYSGSAEVVFWTVKSAFSFRAPRGTLDAMTPLMLTSIRSIRAQRDWFDGYCYCVKLFYQNQLGIIQDTARFGQMITAERERVRQMNQGVYEERMAMLDRQAQQFGELMKGVDTFNDPYTNREVELPSGYKHAWTTREGEVVLSDDGYYNPNQGDTREWTEMRGKWANK